MHKINRPFLITISLFLFTAYILPYWFIIKESASIRSKFSIKRIGFTANAKLQENDLNLNCNLDFNIIREERTSNIKINCEEAITELKFKEMKLVSQNIKSNGKHFIKPLIAFIENEDLILPLPISYERLKNRICQIVTDCSNVRYKRLGGVVNYQFLSKETGSFYMIEKESLFPSALSVKEKDLTIEAKKYYSFSTNIKFPSLIEIKHNKQYLILKVEDIEIE